MKKANFSLVSDISERRLVIFLVDRTQSGWSSILCMHLVLILEPRASDKFFTSWALKYSHLTLSSYKLFWNLRISGLQKWDQNSCLHPSVHCCKWWSSCWTLSLRISNMSSSKLETYWRSWSLSLLMNTIAPLWRTPLTSYSATIG